MAYELIGVAGLTVELRQTYERMLLMRARPKFVHANPAWAKVANVPERGGRSVQWRRLEAITGTTTALTEGTPGAATQITFSSVAATIDQYGQFTQITDVVQTQAIDPVVAELVEMYGETLGDSMDLVVRNVITGGTTIQYASTAGSRAELGSGMRFTYAEIRESVNTLTRNNAKRFPDGAYKGIIHPDTARDMFGDSDIIQSFQQAGPRDANNPMMTGVIGRFYGVDWIETTNARIRPSLGLSGADVYQTLIFGQEWYGMSDFTSKVVSPVEVIVKPLGSAGTNDPLNQVATVGWKAAITAAILNQTFGISIEHTTSRSNAA